jgi:hypothetical protein
MTILMTWIAGLIAMAFLYQTPQFTFTESEESITYTDIAGRERTINIMFRLPDIPIRPLPVVVWSHGGFNGQTNPGAALNEWSEVTARSGYLTVTIAHTPRGPGQRSDLCLALGITAPADCDAFHYLNWDRPHDLKQVLDELERQNVQGPLRGRLDLDRIAVGGHSAGSAGALSIAGAVRVFNQRLYSFEDSRPVAFLAFSPQGPTSEGFFDTDLHKPDTSWDPLERPVLVATGDGDSNCDPRGDCMPGANPAYARRVGFNRMPGGNKYLLYIQDAEAYHGMFGLDEDCVAQGLSPAKCQAFSDWLTSGALAFLDAHVRRSAVAYAWLQNGLIEAASNKVVEWIKK